MYDLEDYLACLRKICRLLESGNMEEVRKCLKTEIRRIDLYRQSGQ